MLFIAAFLLIGLSVFLALEFSSTSTRQVKAQLKRASVATHVGQRDKELAKSAGERLLYPMVHQLSSLAMRVSPQGNRVALSRKLQAAGVTMPPQTFLAIKSALSIGCLLVGGLMTIRGNAVGVFVGLALAALMFRFPDIYLSKKQSGRRFEMERSLPDTLDLLTVSVEAGLGFDSAISKVCEKMKGPLVDEFATMGHEIRVGESRRQALRNMSDRVGSPLVSSFCRSIIQADELGTSLGRTLRVQAVDMRIKRQLQAEEKAMKAPVKMLFPTVLFIFPAMFIVILSPAFISLMDSFANL